MRRTLTAEEMIAGDPRRILMEEASSRCSTQSLIFTDKPGFTCDDHPELAALGVYISLTAQADCYQCRGADEDDVCHDFCPVCEFCCGC